MTLIGVLRTGGYKANRAQRQQPTQHATANIVQVHLVSMDDVADDVAIPHDTRDRDRLTV